MSNELKKLQPLMIIIMVLTIGLLAWFHADLWFGQGGGDESSWRLGLMALLSDGAKVALFSAGFWLVLNADRWPVAALGGLSIAVSLALVVLSVTGVFGGLSVNGAKMIDNAKPDQGRITELANLAQSYSNQVASLEASKALLPADWYTKRGEIDSAIQKAQAGQQTALDQKVAIPAKQPVEASFFVGVAAVTGWTEAQARTRVYGAYAILLELVSLLSTLLAFFGAKLADGPGTAKTEPAKTAKVVPKLAETVPAKNYNPLPAQELTKYAKARQTMERYLAAAYADIEAGQGDAFLGRNKIMSLSGLDRAAVEWSVRQLALKGLVVATTSPARTVPVSDRKATLERLFGTAMAQSEGGR